ncbi:MAG: class B sortase [Oscillospiraceae bacterium]|jgi:sortase B|nr:class B sortase [Oscillospiraceae bacterium]
MKNIFTKSFINTKERVWRKKWHLQKLLLKSTLVLLVCVFIGTIFYIGSHYYSILSQRRIENHILDLFERAKEDWDSNADTDIEDNDEGYTRTRTISDRARERQKLLEREAEGRIIYAEILEINDDFLGMISIPGLMSPQPYVHGNREVDYLQTDFYGRRNRNGTVYLSEQNCRLLMDHNSVFYGHHSTNGVMFTNLMAYKSADAFKRAPVVKLDGLVGESTWIIFSAHITEPSMWFTYPRYSKDDFEDLIIEMQNRSLFVTDVDVNRDDRVITLAVCDYTYENMRFVVHARKLRPGEEVPSEVIATPNTDMTGYEIPHLKALVDVNTNGMTITHHPTNPRLFYYKVRSGGIDRFSGDIQHIQGPFSSISHGGITNNTIIASLIRRIGPDDETSSELLIAVQGLNRGIGITMFSALTPTSNLRQGELLTPEFVDAVYPALQETDNVIWLLYSVQSEDKTLLYRQQIHNELPYGDPQLVYTVQGVDDARFVGFYHTTYGTIIVWHEVINGLLKASYIGGESYIIIENMHELTRVTLFGIPTSNTVRIARMRQGVVGFSTINFFPPDNIEHGGEIEDINDPDDFSGDSDDNNGDGDNNGEGDGENNGVIDDNQPDDPNNEETDDNASTGED